MTTKTTITLAATVHIALIDACHQSVAAAVAETDGISAALAATNSAKIGKLATLATIWPMVAEPITGAVFDAQCKQVMRDDYVASKRYSSEGSIDSLLNNDKVAAVALSHGSHLGVSLLPIAGESLRPYCDRVRLLMQASTDTVPAIWKSKTNKAKASVVAPIVLDAAGQATAPVKTITKKMRDAALLVVCRNDAADAMMLDMMTDEANIKQTRSMFAILFPIKTK
jgi:hypothetical protein